MAVSVNAGSFTLDSPKLEYRCRVIYAGVPSLCCFEIRGRSYSKSLALTVEGVTALLQRWSGSFWVDITVIRRV